tara:strand:- start:288 stop:458 length:171 start_codon:yes stop_codon:yes gene_type:complete
MLKICSFAHFIKNNSLEDNIINYLKTIKELVKEVFFISRSQIDSDKFLKNNIVSKI